MSYSVRYDPGPTYLAFVVLTTVVGLTGNALVLVLTADVKISFLSYSVYLKFLAVSDGIVLATTCTHETLKFFNSFHYVFGNLVLCDVWRGVRFVVALLSPWLVVGLTVDRFYCVVFPLTRNRFCTQRKAVIVCTSMTVASFVVIFPFLVDVSIVDDPNVVCVLNEKFAAYFSLIRLFLNSAIPCLLIFVFNVVIVVHIQRSAAFRRRFAATTATTTTTSSSNSNSRHTQNKVDKSLPPLMLISILAFVTLLPAAIVESSLVVMIAFKSYGKVLFGFMRLWAIFNILYLVNFGQNFYILMSSSPSYRTIMKKRFRCWKRAPLRTEGVGASTLSVGVAQSGDVISRSTDSTFSHVMHDTD